MTVSMLVLSLGAFAGLAVASEAAPGLTASHLRCEYLTNPIGLDERHPRLCWTVASPQRGQKQTAYQILVASSAEKLAAEAGDLWDTGRVESDETTHIAYAGASLASEQRCWWKVRTWDRDGVASAWSEPASWEMALLEDDDWQAQWIGLNDDTAPQPLPLLRREFALSKPIRSARVYVTGLGYYELRINGQKVGDRCLEPGYTRYDRRVLYATHDVTELLQQGDNAAGIMLGNGWYNVQAAAAWDFDQAPWRASPRAMAQLHVHYADGTTEIIASDGNWRAMPGPVTFNTIYGGEAFDARREPTGWDQPEFDDSQWQAAAALPAPAGKLSAQAMHPIRVTQTLAPASVAEVEPGVYVFDTGQNLTGRAALRIAGPAGTEIKLKYGELLDGAGRVDQSNIGVHVWNKGADQRFQTDSYILKGDGEETWHSRFVYHGFQYVEVTGAPGALTLDNLQIQVVHSALPEVGRFACSNPLLNRIWEASRWSYLSNLHGIPTDCPHREKNGWMADAHLSCEFGLWNYDGATVYEKWLEDIADEQRDDGSLPGIVPTGGWGYHWGNGPAWDSAFLIIPDYLHLYYGDPRARTQHFDQHCRYVDYISQRSDNGVNSIGLGDWVPAKTQTPEAVTSTAYHVCDARIVAATARLTGDSQAAAKYDAVAEKVRQAFHDELYDAESGAYSIGSQTAQSCALFMDMAPAEQRGRVLDALVRNVQAADNHLDTGVLGAKFLLMALSNGGRADLAYEIATQRTRPSWGWWFENGANTLYESWDLGLSHNHAFLGDCSNWYVRVLAGINPDAAAPGFKHIVIRPQPVGDLTFAEAEYHSIRGLVKSSWSRENGEFRLNVTIPTNTTATIYLPADEAASVREGGRPLDDVAEARLANNDAGVCTVEVLSGEYEFTSPLAEAPAAE